MSWSVQVNAAPDSWHVRALRWPQGSPYPVTLVDFEMEIRPGETELNTLCRMSGLLWDALDERRNDPEPY